jgi:hypothetical protein
MSGAHVAPDSKPLQEIVKWGEDLRRKASQTEYGLFFKGQEK